MNRVAAAGLIALIFCGMLFLAQLARGVVNTVERVADARDANPAEPARSRDDGGGR